MLATMERTRWAYRPQPYLPAQCANCRLRFGLHRAQAEAALAQTPVCCPYCQHVVKLLPRDRARVAEFLATFAGRH